MPAFLVSATFWKFIGIAALVAIVTVSVGLFINHYRDLEAQAAMVPGLQQANKSLAQEASVNDKRAGDLAGQLVKAQADRDQAIQNFNAFQDKLKGLEFTLNGIAKNANATKNPVCLPSASDISLFNTTVAGFQHRNAGSGQASAGSPVPANTH